MTQEEKNQILNDTLINFMAGVLTRAQVIERINTLFEPDVKEDGGQS